MAKTKNAQKLRQRDVSKALKFIAEKNKSKEFVVARVSHVRAVLENEFGIDVSRDTVQANGISKYGYYEKNFPDCCKYNDEGDKSKWGLVLKPGKFIDEVNV